MSDESEQIPQVDIFRVGRYWWLLIAKNIKTFLIVGAIAGALAVLLALVLPARYEVEATLLPPSSSATSGASSIMAQLGSVSGLSFGRSSNSDLYPTIVKSETILDSVLTSPYGKSDIAHALLRKKAGEPISWRERKTLVLSLQRSLKASTDKLTDEFSLRYEQTDPKLAAKLVNQTILELEDFFQSRYKTEARNQRLQIETRLEQVSDSLKSAEEALVEFRSKNRSTGSSPQLMMTENRLRRGVELHSTVFVELNKQLELAKISEVGDSPVINVLDWAEPPVVKSWPPRRNIVVGITGGALVLLLAFYYLRDAGYLRRLRGVFVDEE